MTIDLGNGVTFDACRESGVVVTRYADGFECGATRPDTPENRAEVIDQGYEAEGALWRSLVEHELLHTLIARHVFSRESLVLRHESGAEQHRYALRLHEEALAISYQRWLNTEEPDPVLWPHSALLVPLRARMHELLKAR